MKGKEILEYKDDNLIGNKINIENRVIKGVCLKGIFANQEKESMFLKDRIKMI